MGRHIAQAYQIDEPGLPDLDLSQLESTASFREIAVLHPVTLKLRAQSYNLLSVLLALLTLLGFNLPAIALRT